MTSYLVDLNVWLALCSDRHVHFPVALEWLSTIGQGQACFCRLTQIGLLRLLANSRVMGPDVLGQSSAWKVYDRLCADYRVSFVSEPPGVEAGFRRLTQDPRPAKGGWTDAYLVALARALGLTIVSFDRDFLRAPGVDVLALPLR